MDNLRQDIRYTFATMRRSPGFAAVAVTTLALGIGATTAVYSVVYDVLLRPLPYPASERLVRLWEEHPGGVSPAGNRWLSNQTYWAWVEHPRALEGIGAYATYEYTVNLGDESVRLVGSSVSPTVFGLLGVTPAAGRFFNAEEADEGANRVVVLSDRLWRERYSADPAILGRRLHINEQPHVIVGIARPELRFPDSRVLFWVPNTIARVTPEATRPFTALGRLRGGVTPAQAEAEGTAIARSIVRPVVSTQLFFGKGGPPVVHARSLVEDVTAPVRPALLVLGVAVTLVLLIACANVANLFLSRGVARSRELAIRAAIGGSRARLVRQLFTESTVLAGAGGLLGVFVAGVLMRAMPLLAPARFPRLDDVRLDWGVLGIAAVASLFTAIASGLAPSMRGTRFELAAAMRGGTGSGADGSCSPRARRFHQAILVLESAFAVILVVGAGLLARSFVRLVDVDPGYRAERVLTARVHLPRSAPPERTAALIDVLLSRLRVMPGVTAAGAGNMVPLLSMTAVTTFRVPATAGGASTNARAATYVITPGYAETLGLKLRAGRLFTEADTGSGVRKMLVNEEFVRQYLAGSGVGRRFENLYMNDRGITTEVVGVVGNVLKDGHDRDPQPEIYFLDRSPTMRLHGAFNVVVRTTGDPAALAPRVRQVIREADSTAVIEQVAPLTDLVARSFDQPRFATTVMTTFAALALALASVGLYGVLAHTVAQRRRELGIRAAIGAGQSDLLRLVLREGLTVTLLGAAIGLVGAAWVTQFMRAVLFGVTPADPIAFVTAPLVVLSVATLASLQPAFRAASIDPALALRAD